LLSYNWLIMPDFAYFAVIKKIARNRICDQRGETGLKLVQTLKFPVGYPHATFQEEISKCNRSAYIDDESKLHRFYMPSKWNGEYKPKFPLYHTLVSFVM